MTISHQRQALRILLVDDQELNQLVAVTLMQYLGFRCDVAGDGLEAVRMALDRSYDVILMDVHMPRLSGIEATRRLREQSSGDVPWIVALTTDVLESNREKCLAAGMNDFVGKPISAPTLLAVLDGALDRGDLRANALGRSRSPRQRSWPFSMARWTVANGRRGIRLGMSWPPAWRISRPGAHRWA